MRFKLINRVRLPNGDLNTEVKSLFRIGAEFNPEVEITLEEIAGFLDKYQNTKALSKVDIETEFLSFIYEKLGVDESKPMEAVLALSYIILRTSVFNFDNQVNAIVFGVYADQAFKAISEANLIMPRQFYQALKRNMNDDNMLDIIQNRHSVVVKHTSDEELETFAETLKVLIEGDGALSDLLSCLGIDMPSKN